MKQTITQSQQITLTHEQSMQLMWAGQVIFELEELYANSLTRQMKEKIKHASNIFKEISEIMTPMTKDRMLNWKNEGSSRTYVESENPWDKMSLDTWLHTVLTKCKQGFCAKL